MRNRWILAMGIAAIGTVAGLPEHGGPRAGRVQESGPARHALLRREQRSGRRRADGPEEAARPVARWCSPTRRSKTPPSTATIFKPFTDYLAQCTGKRVVYYPVKSNAAEIEAMRSGRLHVAGFSTGPTGFAVNIAGAVPFAAKGTEKGPQGYHLLVDREGVEPVSEACRTSRARRVAHTAPSSNSGHLAPRVLYPAEGLTPNEDYKPLMSGGHDKSALGVASGDYDMARRRIRRATSAWSRAARSRATTCASSTRARCSRPRRSPTRTT